MSTFNALRVSLFLALFMAGMSGKSQKKGAEVLSSSAQISPRRSNPTVVPATTAPIQIRVGPYLGWDRAFTISNGNVEAIIVPAIGRVMQFRFVGQSSPFWEDTTLRGTVANPSSPDWANFGGDKTWPSPQSDWDKITPRSWPPPIAFDAMPVEMFVRRDALVMKSPVDPHYGIRTERMIELDHDAPIMTISTTYEKVSGEPLKVGVWIITQLEDPIGVFAPIPVNSLFSEGYVRQSGDALPSNLKFESGLLSLTRDSQKSTKIGMDAGRLLWVGPTQMLLIESPRLAGAEYPDQRCSAEVYTNPDPKTYVELELLGPLQVMKPGDQIHQSSRYSLHHRMRADPAMDARRLLNSR